MILSGIDLFDIVLSIFYSSIIILITFLVRRNIKDSNIRKYFVPYVFYKIITAVAFVLIHVFYYKGGDTFLYFFGSKFFVDIFQANPEHFFSYFFSSFENLNHFTITNNYWAYSAFNGKDVLFLSRFLAPFTFLGFKQFLASTILYTMFCSYGHWLIFTTFSKLYPSLTKHFALGTLFFPTIALWSSGILKDTIILTALGVMFSATYILTQKKKMIAPSIGIVLSIYVCLILKPYVLYLFIPMMLYWAQAFLKNQLNDNILKYVLTPLIVIFSLVGGYFLINNISEDAGKYSLESMESVAKGFHSWHNYLAETRNQSGYTLGNIEYTFTGIAKKVPESIFVAFFRPFPFVDTRNAATWFEGIQSFILLIISLYVLLKTGIVKSMRIIFTNRSVLAFLCFALAFGFAVGFTSYNFGALSRYKIPALPFYTAALAIIWFEGKKMKAKK